MGALPGVDMKTSYYQWIQWTLGTIGVAILFASPLWLSSFYRADASDTEAAVANREEVVFWHFWGGQDKAVVDDVVRRFNESQDQYRVRAVAMPGNNLQAKLFLAITGGDPPDLVNQDDPILADWAKRGIIQPLENVAPPEEVDEVTGWLFDSARRLSVYDGTPYAVCNGLDIRALFLNKTALENASLVPPVSNQDLNRVANVLTPANERLQDQYAYLPDSRRLWAWGFVFGGDFYEPETGQVSLTSPQIVQALAWMQSFSKKYGPDNVAAFRQGDQSLPGKTFPLLPLQSDQMIGRYSMVMDGQWRVRDLAAFKKERTKQGLESPEFEVVPLPAPETGRTEAGWVNGNFFIIPKGAPNAHGSWEFIKFWIGFSDPVQSVTTHTAGGWIPVSQSVVDHPEFQAHLKQQPLFKTFVDLAASPNQFPIPQIPGAPFFRRRVEAAGYEAIMNPDRDPLKILEQAQKEINEALKRRRK